MPYNVNKTLLVGAGGMAIEYAKVLVAQDIPFIVVGRGMSSSKSFKEKTGIDVLRGGLSENINALNDTPQMAIVAVNVEELASVTLNLLKKGVKRILLEKPAGINIEEILIIDKEAKMRKSVVYVAYNRRFYASTLKAKEIIAEDGGVTSFVFEFTEWSHIVEKLEINLRVKNKWFLANSTHVVDLAFYLCGEPIDLCCYTSGSLSWHSSAAVFAGAGTTEKGALFSYHANWSSPGRWGVEIMTKKHRLIFRPMEQLHVQDIASITVNKVELEDELDKKYKPGLYKQIKAFYAKQSTGELLVIEDHLKRFKNVYSKIVHPKS